MQLPTAAAKQPCHGSRLSCCSPKTVARFGNCAKTEHTRFGSDGLQEIRHSVAPHLAPETLPSQRFAGASSTTSWPWRVSQWHPPPGPRGAFVHRHAGGGKIPVGALGNTWPRRARSQHSCCLGCRMPRYVARPNQSFKLTRYGSRRLAAPGHGVNCPSAASRRLPPRSA